MAHCFFFLWLHHYEPLCKPPVPSFMEFLENMFVSSCFIHFASCWWLNEVKGAKTAVWLHLRISCAPREIPDADLGVGGFWDCDWWKSAQINAPGLLILKTLTYLGHWSLPFSDFLYAFSCAAAAIATVSELKVCWFHQSQWLWILDSARFSKWADQLAWAGTIGYSWLHRCVFQLPKHSWLAGCCAGQLRIRTEQLLKAWLKPESVDTVHFKVRLFLWTCEWK